MNIATKLKKYFGDATGPFGFPMTSALAREAEDAMKGMPADLRKSCKTMIGGHEVEGYCRMFKTPGGVDLVDGERADISLITTGSIDRDREVVVPGGGNFKQFRQNPVVTWAHYYDALPVGRCLWIQRSESANPAKDGFQAKTSYSIRPQGWVTDWFPDAVWSMIQGGDLRGKSIGFIPMDGKQPEEKDIKARPELAGVCWIITKWMLLEYAVAPVQSNPDALVVAAAKLAQKGFKIPSEMLEGIGVYLPSEVPSLEELLTEPDTKSADEPAEPPVPVAKAPAFITEAEYRAALKDEVNNVIKSMPAMMAEAMAFARGDL